MNSIRYFIRESIQNIDESSLALAAALFNSAERIHQNAPPQALEALFAGNLVDEKFSAINHDVEPDFVVIADNSSQQRCLIKKYSQSNIETDLLLTKLNARKIRTSDIKTIDDIITNAGGWTTSPTLLSYFKSQVVKDTSEVYPSRENPQDLVAQPFIRNDFYIVPRDIKKFKLPTFLATKSAKEKLDAGECALSVEEAVAITFKEDVTSKKWALAVTCWYAYATSVKVQALSWATGALIGGLAGGPKGAWKGATIGGISADVLLRIPVMIWAHKTEKKTILYANAAYCVVIIAFGSLIAFREARALKQINNLEQSSAAAVAAARASSRAGGSAARGMTDAAKYNIKITDIKDAQRFFAWDQIKVILAQLAAELITGLASDPDLDTAALAAIFEDPDSLATLVGESQKELKSYVDNLYPNI